MYQTEIHFFLGFKWVKDTIAVLIKKSLQSARVNSSCFEETIESLSKTASFVYDIKCLKGSRHRAVLLFLSYD